MATEMVTRDLEGALPGVTAPAASSTAVYRGAVSAFLSSGYPATVSGFREYIESLKGTCSAAKVNLALAAGRKAFIQAAERLGLPSHQVETIRGAVAAIRAVKMARPDVTTVSPAERFLLLDALPLRVRLMAETLYQTGARVSELLTVRRDAVKANGSAEIRLYGKGGKERRVKISRPLYDRILDAFPGPFLFTTSEGNPYTRQYVSREIARAARRALGRSITAHVLRHSRATDLYADTGRVKAISAFLGHADEAVTLRYYVSDTFTDSDLGIEGGKA